ncbi:MAG: DUF1365 family protein [Zhongshania sp.]|uniref:DUF1365 domain-containing protein n=1 Tax=Zhongshania sp. TaxID=1971902 RepID=UPI0026342692|nr:DUF1365 family protein [Zhongshania sp.]MDF1692584.1 DUF1365 family protein [Zhongshania sp.]
MSAELRTAIYRGEVRHQRLAPLSHRFAYRISSFLFDLDELDQAASHCRWFSVNRFNLFSFHFKDIGNGSGETPRSYLERSLKAEGIDDTLARASLLCYPRIMGYTFNPLSVYYCYNEQQQLFAVLYEVSNTFKQRHSYLFAVAKADREKTTIQQQCDKNFYVSPFNSMAMRYKFRLLPPLDKIGISIRVQADAKDLLHAAFQGQRRPFNDRELLRNFCTLPFMTLKVLGGIHWEALKLFCQGLKLVPRPAEPSSSISRIDK